MIDSIGWQMNHRKDNGKPSCVTLLNCFHNQYRVLHLCLFLHDGASDSVQGSLASYDPLGHHAQHGNNPMLLFSVVSVSVRSEKNLISSRLSSCHGPSLTHCHFPRTFVRLIHELSIAINRTSSWQTQINMTSDDDTTRIKGTSVATALTGTGSPPTTTAKPTEHPVDMIQASNREDDGCDFLPLHYDAESSSMSLSSSIYKHSFENGRRYALTSAKMSNQCGCSAGCVRVAENASQRELLRHGARRTTAIATAGVRIAMMT